MSENSEYPGTPEEKNTADPFFDAVVRERPDGTMRSDDAVRQIATLGRTLALATEFRKHDKGLETASGLVEVLEELGQKRLIQVAGTHALNQEK